MSIALIVAISAVMWSKYCRCGVNHYSISQLHFQWLTIRSHGLVIRSLQLENVFSLDCVFKSSERIAIPKKQIVHIDGTVCNPRERFLHFEERNYWSLGTDCTIRYSDWLPQFFENHIPSWYSYHFAYVGMFAKADTFRDLLTKNSYKWKQFCWKTRTFAKEQTIPYFGWICVITRAINSRSCWIYKLHVIRQSL